MQNLKGPSIKKKSATSDIFDILFIPSRKSPEFNWKVIDKKKIEKSENLDKWYH